jgi:chromosome segregation ATPase
MSKPAKNEQSIPDFSESLEQLGETTTAAELVRTKGQSKKLRVISEKKLMDWILAMLNQHMAGKADTFSDQEKEELLKKTQDELNKRIKREQDAQGERDRLKNELERAMSKVAEAQSGKANAEQLNEALAMLKKKLDEAELVKENLQQDIYDLHDQIGESSARLSATLVEKDKLKETVKGLMQRAGDLVAGVLGLDEQLYGGRHGQDNPVAEDAEAEQEFYHDYEVGAQVIATLSNDLQRLRGIAQSAKEKDEQAASDPRMSLLEGDLQLLEQLKDGSLHAMDVAEPVTGLVEAMEGARLEAEQLEHTGCSALGVAAGREDTISSVPDANGDPAEVLAGTTGVVRELASSLARGRQRLVALKEMADQADEARNSAEQENEELRAAYQQVLAALAERAKADKLAVPKALADESKPAEERGAAAAQVIQQLRGGGDEAKQVISDQLLIVDRLLGEEAGVHMAPPAKNADQEALVARLRENSEALERLVRSKKDELAAAQQREKALAEQVRALAKARSASIPADFAGGDEPLDVSLKKLDQALDAGGAGSAEASEAAKQVIAALQDEGAKGPSPADLKRLDDERSRLASQIGQAQQKIVALESELSQAKGEVAAVAARSEARKRAEREIANELVRAAKGDHTLAETTADLAMAVDSNTGEDLAVHLREAVTNLTRRKHDLAEENERVRSELDSIRAQAQEASTRNAALQSEQQKAAFQASQAQQRMQDLERDLSRAKTDLELMRNQAQDAVSRRNALDAERSKLTAQVASAEQKLHETEAALATANDELAQARADKRAKDDADRTVATELVRAAQGDAELADSTADLALALEDTASSANPVDSATVTQQVVQTVNLLARRKQELTAQVQALQKDTDALKWKLKEADDKAKELESERDEMAASGKEIINLLTHQRERTTQELETIKKAHEESGSQLARFQHRANAAETANRQLAEALSALAAAEKDQQGTQGVEDKRVDLELALSQLPDEGEDAVTIPEDLSLQLAASGQKLAEALLQRRQAVTSSFRRAEQDQQTLKAQLEKLKGEIAAAQNALSEQESALRSSQAEVKAVRQEIINQGKDLSDKVRELTNTRGEMASVKAEFSVAAQRVEDQERRLAQAGQQLSELRQEHERVLGDLKEAQERADAASHAQTQVVQALRSLTNRQDASPALARALTEADFSDPLSKAGQKLDMAHAAGPEQMASASQAYVQALRERVQALAESHEETRGRLSAAKASEDHLQNELAGLRASVVDRDHQLQNLAQAVEKTKAEQSDLINQLMEQRRAHDATAAAAKQVQEQLRLAQAEIADYQARDSASSGHFSSDNDRLRQEVERERKAREELEAKLSELSERAESGDARLRAQRDEFTRRLAERDNVIQQKDRQLDAQASQRADAKSLEAQVAALTKELGVSSDRIKELESVYGVQAGNAVKSTDLAREVKNLQAERDQLRERHRQTEAEHADAVSYAAQLKSQLDEKRKEGDGAREKLHKELAEEREKSNAMRDEFRKLKEEVVGLRARIRRLTDGGAGGPSGGFPTLKG